MTQRSGTAQPSDKEDDVRNETALKLRDRQVWKFTLPMPNATGRSYVDMPAWVKPLSVGLQDGVMVVWALVAPFAEIEEGMQPEGPRRFIIANTGMEIPGFPDGAVFLGTVTSNGIVWHVWDGDAETTA